MLKDGWYGHEGITEGPLGPGFRLRPPHRMQERKREASRQQRQENSLSSPRPDGCFCGKAQLSAWPCDLPHWMWAKVPLKKGEERAGTLKGRRRNFPLTLLALGPCSPRTFQGAAHALLPSPQSLCPGQLGSSAANPQAPRVSQPRGDIMWCWDSGFQSWETFQGTQHCVRAPHI